MIKLRNLSVFLLVFALAACAQLGIAPADTFNKKVAAAAASVQTIYDAGNAAYQADKITTEQASNLVDALNGVLATLNTAEKMHAADPTGAETKLAAALQILTALNAYIITHQAAAAPGKPS